MESFFNLENCRTALYQWDINQRIIILDENINEVHYEIQDLNRSIPEKVYEEDGLRYCKIPQAVLEQPKDVTVYAFIRSKDSGYTKVSGIIHINGRKIPTNYHYYM